MRELPGGSVANRSLLTVDSTTSHRGTEMLEAFTAPRYYPHPISGRKIRSSAKVDILLGRAIKMSLVHATKYLLKHGARVNRRNVFGEMPLTQAASLYLSLKDIEKVSGKDDERTSMQLEIIRLLVNHGANMRTENKYGESLYFLAKVSGDLALAELCGISPIKKVDR